MLQWNKNYYIGEGIKNPHDIQQKLNRGKLVPFIYLLTLSRNEGNLMEIIPAAMLIQKSCYTICPPVIGMAMGKDQAMEMAGEIVMEAYRQTGSFKVAEYLKNR